MKQRCYSIRKTADLNTLNMCRGSFNLETMKGGQILGSRELTEKSSYTFGRAAGSDWVLEHPSISRLHAVLQFRADGPPALFDCGSTHGSFLNKKRLQPNVYVPLRQGFSLLPTFQGVSLFSHGQFLPCPCCLRSNSRCFGQSCTLVTV